MALCVCAYASACHDHHQCRCPDLNHLETLERRRLRLILRTALVLFGNCTTNKIPQKTSNKHVCFNPEPSCPGVMTTLVLRLPPSSRTYPLPVSIVHLPQRSVLCDSGYNSSPSHTHTQAHARARVCSLPLLAHCQATTTQTVRLQLFQAQ